LLIAAATEAGSLVAVSGVLLSEAAYSAAGALSEFFLLAALRLSSRLPDGPEPFGYGNEHSHGESAQEQ
jgi:divalent metal cation (Fe/Co/Zn/Cd) transporter